MPIMIGQDPRNCPYPQNPSAIQIKLSRRFLVYFSAVVVPLESQKVSQHAVVCRTVTEEFYAFEMIASARACFITQRVIRARKGEGVRQEGKSQEQCSHEVVQVSAVFMSAEDQVPRIRCLPVFAYRYTKQYCLYADWRERGFMSRD